jgi:GNAT superfamily N-acetyltransferase
VLEEAMGEDNLQRMLQLAEEFFGTRNDPTQISVNEDVIAKLRQIHPATLSEEKDENGPIAWMLVIPTTHQLMEQFIAREINEQELLDRTIPGGTYDALYLCSALVLPEHRGKGLAKHLVSSAITAIRKDHPIHWCFYWALSAEGEKLATAAAGEFGLPLYCRPE